MAAARRKPGRALWAGAAALALALAAIAIALGVTGGESTSPGEAAGDGRPNVIVVITDDQATSAFTDKTMPFTRRAIGRDGTTFERALVTSPLCCPARASFLTGQYTHNHGAWNSYKTFERPDEQLAGWLGAAGYRTAMVGKFLNHYEDGAASPEEPAPGWDEWRLLLEPLSYYDYDVSVNGRRESLGDRPADYQTSYLNREVDDLVRRWAPERRPFFIWYAPHAPHDEKSRSGGPCGGRAVPAPGDLRPFATEPLPRPPSFNEPDVSDKPTFMRQVRPLGAGEIRDIERVYRCRLASLREVDRGVRMIVEGLRDAGELENTIVVFTSDNGLFAGEHRLSDGKRLAYTESIEVPMVARVPERLLGVRAAKRVEARIANIDLAPTLLELAGARPCLADGACRTMDGRSLVPLLAGERPEWVSERGLLVEMRNCRYRALLAAERITIEHTSAPRRPTKRGCRPTDAAEEYRLDEDPYQLRNLVRGVDEVAEERIVRLRRLSMCAGIAGRDPEPDGGARHCE